MMWLLFAAVLLIGRVGLDAIAAGHLEAGICLLIVALGLPVWAIPAWTRWVRSQR